MSAWSFLLAHHTDEALSRCFRMGPVRLCARCSGLWPGLLLGLALQRLHLPRAGRADLPVMLALILPALWDHARSLRWPSAGNNLWRAGTGLLLGLGLARASVIGWVEGYASVGFLFPILLCLSWVAFARTIFPAPPEAPSS